MTFSNRSDLAAPRGKSRTLAVPTEVQRGLQDGPRDRKGKTRPVKTTTVVRLVDLRGVAPSLSPAPGASGRANSVDDAQMDFVTIFPLNTPARRWLKVWYLTLRLIDSYTPAHV
jgi:hypothetical protein